MLRKLVLCSRARVRELDIDRRWPVQSPFRIRDNPSSIQVWSPRMAMFHVFAQARRVQLVLDGLSLRVFGTWKTIPFPGWTLIFTGRLSNFRPRIFLIIS